MDKLQKIGSWIWYNKERMMLVVMIAVLAYRVYGVMYPEPSQTWSPISTPQAALPEDGEERQTLGLPANPPAPPPIGFPGVYASLYERNPFWYYSGQAQQQSGQTARAEDLNIQLVDIQVAAGRPRARLKTIRTEKWYSENEPFEEFELLQIDPDAQTVVVYSERFGRPFTLEKQ